MNSISQQQIATTQNDNCNNQHQQLRHQLKQKKSNGIIVDEPVYAGLDSHINAEKDYQKLERKKLHAIKELLQTERDYVKSLSYLVEVCLSALNRQQWIPISHRSLIARNSREIFEFHKQFIVYYDTIATYDNDWSFIAQTFLDQMEQFLLYKTYCDLHSDAWALICKYRDQPEWMYFLQDCVKIGTYSIPFDLLTIDSSTNPHHQQKKLLFEDYLIKPVQRICRYQLLIKGIIRYTDYQTPEYKLWSTVLYQLQHIVTDIDMTHFHRDIQERTHRFINRVTSDWRRTTISKDHLIQLGNFLMGGAIEVTYSAFGHSVSKTRYLGCFVFATYMVMVEPRKSTLYEPKYWFPLRIAVLDDTEGEIQQHSFIITCKKHMFAFRASCALEKRLWVQKIQEAISTCKDMEKAPIEFIIPSSLDSGMDHKLLLSRRSMIQFKEPTGSLKMKRKITMNESTKKRRSMDISLLSKTVENTSEVYNMKPITLGRPKSMVSLSTSNNNSSMIRKMSMQFKNNHHQMYDDVDYKLHDVCTLDYLSSRAWHRHLYSFTTSQRPDLKKQKSKTRSRFSIRSLGKADDYHVQFDFDLLQDVSNQSACSSTFGHSGIKEDTTNTQSNPDVETPTSCESESTCIEEPPLIKRPSRTKLFTEKIKRKVGSMHRKNTNQNRDKKDLLQENKLETVQLEASHNTTTKPDKRKWKSKLSALIPSTFIKN